MKLKHVFGIIILILIADQALKIWVKTTMPLYSEHQVLGSWFRLYFIENEGMAYGAKFGKGSWAKVALTLFRLFAVIFGTFYLRRIVKEGYHKGFIICAALIYAGALGNLIDSMFYGMIFDKGMAYEPAFDRYIGYSGLASFAKHGYATFLHGNVVDMLYFPIIDIKQMPSWIPIWGGKSFSFFQPIFNLADAAISVGVIAILLFQRRFFKKHQQPNENTAVENVPEEATVQQ